MTHVLPIVTLAIDGRVFLLYNLCFNSASLWKLVKATILHLRMSGDYHNDTCNGCIHNYMSCNWGDQIWWKLVWCFCSDLALIPWAIHRPLHSGTCWQFAWEVAWSQCRSFPNNVTSTFLSDSRCPFKCQFPPPNLSRFSSFSRTSLGKLSPRYGC